MINRNMGCKFINTCTEECTQYTKHCKYYHHHIARDRMEDPYLRTRVWAHGSLSSHKLEGYVIDEDVDIDFVSELLLSTNYICPICNKSMTHSVGHGAGPSSPTLDDINNSHHLFRGNLRVICHACNVMKGARADAEWLAEMELRIRNLKKLLED